MGKAKTIDRLELTKRKFSNIQKESQNETQTESQEQRVQQEVHEEHYGLSTCPNCEQMTLIHEGGCEHCTNCGWSACG